MHTLFGIDLPGPRRSPRWLSRLAMYLRRFRFWLSQFRWWAILALLAGLSGVVIAFADQGMERVVALGALAVTLAILATREDTA